MEYPEISAPGMSASEQTRTLFFKIINCHKKLLQLMSPTKMKPLSNMM